MFLLVYVCNQIFEIKRGDFREKKYTQTKAVSWVSISGLNPNPNPNLNPNSDPNPSPNSPNPNGLDLVHA